MDILMHIDPVSSPHNIKGLRRRYDSVESNVRSLKSLGVELASYGGLLAPVLIMKIPQELQLALNRNDDWNLDSLMSSLEEELQAREKTATLAAPSIEKPSKDPATSMSLFTGSNNNRLTCSYCQQDHTSNSCSVVTQPYARKQILQKVGRCFVCLRRGHISRECNSHKKCSKCSGRHHVSICMKSSSTPSGHTPTKIPPVVTPQPQPDPTSVPRPGLNTSAPAFQSQEPRSTSLWVNSSRTVLLQTAQAQAFNPDCPERSCKVRL